ncbi:hypothetical protein K5X82_17795 [Halosquirtibacter xylanolyticus]|uniref:hypothetical protein n=1 Tax=Halosquirtibacter xylanolyticus TaxID=3374599 RepID=UPI0037490A13|nr:hypothetical protein K5X82_17795 [Prolixibacteraceae bacterium]
MEEQIDYLNNERVLLWKEIEEIKNERDQLRLEIVKINEELVKTSDDYIKDARRDVSNTTRSLNNAKAKVKEIEALFEDVDLQKVEIEEYKENIKDLLDTSEETLGSIKELKDCNQSIFDEFNQRIVEVKETIEFVENYLSDHPDLSEELESLKKKEDELDQAHNKSLTLQKSISKVKNEIDKVKFELFGFEEEDESGEVKTHEGTVDELKTAYDELKNTKDSLQKDIKNTIKESSESIKQFNDNNDTEFKRSLEGWNKEATDAKDQIKKLLPEALTVGLSHAYSEKKKSEEKNENKLRWQFIGGIFLMILVSCIPFFVSYDSFKNGVPLVDVIQRLPRLTLAILPLYIPVMWITYSANRKQSLAKRLIEEYSHKESLSKTFEGLSTQISKLDDDVISKELRNKLLYNLLDVSSENPGKLISDYNKADHPVMDALDKSVKLANAVDRLNKFPGLSKVSEMIHKHSKDLLSEESEKIEKGMSLVNDEKEDEDEGGEKES